MAETIAMNPGHAQKRETILKRILWIIISILILVSIGEITFQLIVAPQLQIRQIVVESNISIGRDEILGVAGIDGKEYYFSLDVEEVAQKLEEYPIIKEARVKKVFPDTIRIEIETRKAVGLALVEMDGKSVPVSFDEQGVIFQIGSNLTEWEIPIISGLAFRNVELGMQLPSTLHPLLHDLSVLRMKSPTLFNLISEIRIVPLRQDDYELVLYPISYNIKVRIGNRIDKKLIQYTMLVLDVMKQQNITQKVKEIDFRSGEVIYTEFQDG